MFWWRKSVLNIKTKNNRMFFPFSGGSSRWSVTICMWRHFLHVVLAQIRARNRRLPTVSSSCWLTVFVGHSSCCVISNRMAENEANSVLNTETDPCAEDLEEALCVLRGSDPENCSYSRVREHSCSEPQPPCRLHLY